MSDVPNELTGDNKLVPWLNRLRRAVLARTPLPTVSAPLTKTTGGFFYSAKSGGGSGTPDHPFKIKRVSENQFSITPGFIDCPYIWPGDYFSKPTRKTFYASTARVSIGPGENTFGIPNTAQIQPTPDLLNFEVDFNEFSFFDVWYELFQGPSSPLEIMRVLRVAAGGETTYHPGGLSGYNSSEFRLVVPIGTVTSDSIEQFAIGHQPNRVNTGAMRYCGQYSDDRLYFPGDVVRLNIASGLPVDYQLFMNRGIDDGGWDHQMTSYGYAPLDGLGDEIWQRLTPPNP